MSQRIAAAALLASLLAPHSFAQQVPTKAANSANATAAAAASKTPLDQEDLHARILMATKRYKEAEDAYEKLSQESPRDAAYPNFAGIARMQLGDYKGAQKDFDRATKTNKKFADGYNNLGTVAFAEKNYGRALRQYQKAISLEPQVPGYYTNVGYAYFAQKRLPQAMTAFHKALALDPQAFEESSRNGSVMQEQSINDRGLFDFMLAKGYAQTGDAQRSATYLRKAFDEGSKDALKVRTDPAFAGVLNDPNMKDVLDRIAPLDAKAPPAPPA